MVDATPPQNPLTRLQQALAAFDARAWRAIAWSAATIVLTIILIVIGRLYFSQQIDAFIDDTLGAANRGHWGLLATILVFVLTSFVGAPQFALVAASVAVFGPMDGFIYAWLGTIAAGLANYAAGYATRSQASKRFGGATGGRFTRFMGENTFLASALIRNVPSAPFVVVNMAFGIARANIWAFLAGLAIGSVPKTAIIAFGFDAIRAALEGRAGAALLAGAAVIVIWLIGIVAVRAWLKRRENTAIRASDELSPPDTP